MERIDYQPLIVQDIANWQRHEEMELSPWYQRREVWSRPQKAYLINTLFEKKPVPTLYFRHVVDLDKDKSIREVVDGQQRIRAILEYIDGEYSAKHPEYNKRVKYSELDPTDKRQFRETKLSGGWLLGAEDSDVIEIFGRLNSVSKTLNTQEKRNALYSGEMKQFCLSQAAKRISFWKNYRIFTGNSVSRMKEVEFITDLCFNFLYGLSDFRNADLDEMYQKFDETFKQHRILEKRLDRVFAILTEIDVDSISETIFRRSPILFSLVIVLDKMKSVKLRKLEQNLWDIDAKYHEDPEIRRKSAADIRFVDACKSSTQRISKRKERHSYIEKHLL